MYRAIDIANWFIEKFDPASGDLITHLKVQKLLYYAEAWTQVLLDRQLFREDFEAWAHGPVVRAVYNVFRDSKWQPLTTSEDPPVLTEDVEEVLLEVLETYGEASAKTLEKMTHRDRPWIDARKGFDPEERCDNIIPKAQIKEYFLKKYGEAVSG